MKLDVLTYCLKIWLTTVFVSPLIFMLTKLILDGLNLPSVLFLYLVAVMASIAFSIPSIVALWIVTYGLTLTKLSSFKQRIILSVVSFVLTIMALFLALAALTQTEAYYVAALYYTLILFGIWFYKLKPFKQTYEAMAHIKV